MNRGKFIVFEGVDGSGKTTQAKLLIDRLNGLSVNAELTCEPSPSHAGVLIRQILTGEKTADVRSLACLFTADRLEHVTSSGGLLETLSGGTNIICDRYYFSSFAYNSLSVPMDWVINMNSQVFGLLRPDVTVFIDIDPQETMRRMQANRDHMELFEKYDTLVKVRENYFKAFDALKENENIIIVDGVGTPEEVADRVWNAVKDMF